jgi:hypothetical protein
MAGRSDYDYDLLLKGGYLRLKFKDVLQSFVELFTLISYLPLEVLICFLIRFRLICCASLYFCSR